MTDHLASIDPAILADSCDDEFRAAFAAADETTQRAAVGYLNTYAGPWGLKASEEDAVLGIIAALWPEWSEGERSSGIYKFRADERLGRIADTLGEDCGETGVVVLVARIVDSLRTIVGPIREPSVMVAWEMGPALDALRILPARWNGWAVPVMGRAQVEALIACQPAHEYPEDCEVLSFDGDTLIVTPPTHAGPLDPARIEPRDGEYVLDLGWTFDTIEAS